MNPQILHFCRKQEKIEKVNNMVEIFLYIYFVVGAVILETEAEGDRIYSIRPRKIRDFLEICSEIIIDREAEIAIRNNGYFDIQCKGIQESFLRYLEENFDVRIQEIDYFPVRQWNVYTTLQPRYQLKLQNSLVEDFIKHSVLGDTLIIKTKFHRPKIVDWFKLGNKIYQICFDVEIYIPELPRLYNHHGSQQNLQLEKGHKLILTTEEIGHLIGGAYSWTSGKYRKERK